MKSGPNALLDSAVLAILLTGLVDGVARLECRYRSQCAMRDHFACISSCDSDRWSVCLALSLRIFRALILLGNT